jgi:hypothetical protein
VIDNDNVFAVMMEAVRHCSLGQISNALVPGGRAVPAQHVVRVVYAALRVGAGGTAMSEESSLDSAVTGGQRCDQCGARLTEIVTECPFCGARLLNLVSLEDETRAFLESTEIRLIESMTGSRGRPDGARPVLLPGLRAGLLPGSR